MKPEIRKMLVCSTSNVSKNVADILDNTDKNLKAMAGIVWAELEYGWLIRYWPPLRSIDRVKLWPALPRCLRDVIEVAEKNGCSMILFDCDADTLDGVKIFDW